MHANMDILKALRHNRGDSQSDCAKRLGVTLRSVGNWERLPGWLKPRQMRLIYAAYNVTPQVAQTITDQYFTSRGVHNAAPQSREHPAAPAPQATKPHITRFASCRSDYPNTILGFGPKGGAVTLHGALDRLLRDQKPLFGFYCDALIRHIEGRRMSPEQDLYHTDHKPADSDGESLS